jgi:ribosome biogenesis protein BMS1
MIDVAKIADLTLLLIDASFGFEMETMEYLNILSCHGMTRIFGILTHLDLIKKVSTVRAVKKRLKHRFWTEIYDGAKLFYLSGVLNGRYPDREILNLSRFISVLKFRPLVWQSAHPYLLADRMEELTLPQDIEENPLCDRTVTLYGYLRGTNLSTIDPKVHVPGVGDFTVSQVTGLPDPCPSPAAVARERGVEGGKVRRRTLTDKQKMIYAPMSDVGGIMFDKDAVYITVPEKQSFTRTDDEETGVGESLIMKMHGRRNGLDSMDRGLQLFSGAEEITSLPVPDESKDTGRKERRRPQNGLDATDLDTWEDEDEDGDDVDEEIDDGDEEDVDDISRPRLPADSPDDEEDLAFAESDSDMGEPDSENEDGFDASMRWKENLSEKAALSYQDSNSRKMDLTRLIYSPDPVTTVLRQWQEFIGMLRAGAKDTEDTEEPDQGEDEDDFFKKAPDSKEIASDGSVSQYTVEQLNEWANEEKIDSIRNRFITSDLVNGDAEAQDEAEFGDFEDLEAAETNPPVDESQGPLDLEAERAANAKRKEESRLRLEEVEEDPDSLENEEDGELTWGEQQKAKLQRQVELNKHEFEGMDMASRVRVEGYLPGTYVRMVLHGLPCEFIQQFDAKYPIVVGGLLNDEQRFGYIQVITPFVSF